MRPPKSETLFSWERSQLNVQYYSLVPAGTTVIWVLQKWTHGFSEKNPASNRASTRKTVRPPKSETVFSWERSQLNVQYYSLGYN